MPERTVNTRELNLQDRTLFRAAREQRDTTTVPGAPVGSLASAELPMDESGIDFEIYTNEDPYNPDSGSSFNPTEIGNRARDATDPGNLDLPDVDGLGKIKLIVIGLIIVVSAGQLGKLLSFEVGS